MCVALKKTKKKRQVLRPDYDIITLLGGLGGSCHLSSISKTIVIAQVVIQLHPLIYTHTYLTLCPAKCPLSRCSTLTNGTNQVNPVRNNNIR